MGNTVVASRAEMEWNINETFWTFEDKFHFLTPMFKCQNPCLPAGRQMPNE
jgi:hypothetical protein